MPSSYFLVHSSPEMDILVLISTPIAPSAAVNREQHYVLLLSIKGTPRRGEATVNLLGPRG